MISNNECLSLWNSATIVTRLEANTIPKASNQNLIWIMGKVSEITLVFQPVPNLTCRIDVYNAFLPDSFRILNLE